MKALTKTKTKNRKIFSFLQKLGSSLMLPISLLPIGGIFISIGTLVGNEQAQEIFFTLGSIVFDNFPTFVLVSIAFKFTDNSGNATLFGLLFWLSFILMQQFFIDTDTGDVLFWNDLPSFFFTTQLGSTTLSTSLFGGMFAGLFFAYIYNKIINLFLNINLLLRRMFFTFVFISTGFALTMLFLVVWPSIYYGLLLMGEGINAIPYGFNSFLYGTTNRLLLPFGLHSLLLPVMLHSPAGGTLSYFDGSSWQILAEGDSQIWLSLYQEGVPFQIARGGGNFTYNNIDYYLTPGHNPGTYQQGFFPIMIFAFPIAGWAMTKKVETKGQRIAIMVASITPLLTGITEPFEFLFVFISPTLYIFHALFTGLSFLLLDILNTSVWLSSGWFVDVFIFGLVPQLQNSITNFWIIFLVGPIISIPYYFVFRKFYFPNKISKTSITST